VDDAKPPIPLDYQNPPASRFWPNDPLAPARLLGVVFGFASIFFFRLWDQWEESIMRIPRLWYQEAWLGSLAFLLVCAVTISFLRMKFFSALLAGMIAGFLILLVNYMAEVAFFGVDLLGRLTGHGWNLTAITEMVSVVSVSTEPSGSADGFRNG
jgi:H+/Cl- antiporter ClcA